MTPEEEILVTYGPMDIDNIVGVIYETCVDCLLNEIISTEEAQKYIKLYIQSQRATAVTEAREEIEKRAFMAGFGAVEIATIQSRTRKTLK